MFVSRRISVFIYLFLQGGVLHFSPCCEPRETSGGCVRALEAPGARGREISFRPASWRSGSIGRL